jgi:predicted porin
MGTGVHGASRFRFVGVEDIGGGTKANFWLEMQPNLATGGTSSDLFNRGAWVGASGNWGELRLGRQGTNSVAAVCDIDQHGCFSGFYGGGILFSGNSAPGGTGAGLMLANPTRGGGVPGQLKPDGTAATITGGQATSTISSGTATANSGDATRYVRAIRYSLPTLVQGLGVNATYAFGTVATTATNGAAGNSVGVDANYVNSNLKLTGAYQSANADQNDDRKGTLTTLGAIYNLGFASVGAGFQSEKASGTNVTFTSGKSTAITALFPFGAATPYVKYGTHSYSGGSLGSVTNAKIINLGLRYALSPRTYVYGDYVTNGAALAADAKSTTTTFFPTKDSQKSQVSFGIAASF